MKASNIDCVQLLNQPLTDTSLALSIGEQQDGTNTGFQVTMKFEKDPLLSEKNPYINGAMSVFVQEFTQDIYFIRSVLKD